MHHYYSTYVLQRIVVLLKYYYSNSSARCTLREINPCCLLSEQLVFVYYLLYIKCYNIIVARKVSPPWI